MGSQGVVAVIVLSVALLVHHHGASAWNHHHRSTDTPSSPTRRSTLTSIVTTSVAGGLSIVSKEPAWAASKRSSSPEELKRIYDEGASTYESLYSGSIVSRTLDFVALRKKLLSNARGNVLELGVGTGLNLPHYPEVTDSITSYTAMDLSPKMMERAQAKFVSQDIDALLRVAPSILTLYQQDKVQFQIGDVNNLTSLFASTTKFDTIVDTFGLCVFPDPLRALQQAQQLLEPNKGQLLLLEHQDSLIGKALNPTRNIADVISTCRYDDNVVALVKEAGFQSVSYQNIAGGFLVEIIARP